MDALTTTYPAFRQANQRCSNDRVEITELVEFLKRGGGLAMDGASRKDLPTLPPSPSSPFSCTPKASTTNLAKKARNSLEVDRTKETGQFSAAEWPFAIGQLIMGWDIRQRLMAWSMGEEVTYR